MIETRTALIALVLLVGIGLICLGAALWPKGKEHYQDITTSRNSRGYWED